MCVQTQEFPPRPASVSIPFQPGQGESPFTQPPRFLPEVFFGPPSDIFPSLFLHTLVIACVLFFDSLKAGLASLWATPLLISFSFRSSLRSLLSQHLLFPLRPQQSLSHQKWLWKFPPYFETFSQTSSFYFHAEDLLLPRWHFRVITPSDVSPPLLQPLPLIILSQPYVPSLSAIGLPVEMLELVLREVMIPARRSTPP